MDINKQNGININTNIGQPVLFNYLYIQKANILSLQTSDWSL